MEIPDSVPTRGERQNDEYILERDIDQLAKEIVDGVTLEFMKARALASRARALKPSLRIVEFRSIGH